MLITVINECSWTWSSFKLTLLCPSDSSLPKVNPQFLFSGVSLSLLSTLPQIYPFTSPLINISQCPFVRALTPELFSFSQNVRRRRDGGNRSSASSPDYYHFCVNIPVRIGRIWCVNGSKKVKTCSNSAGWKLKSQRTEWSRRRRRDGAATELTSRHSSHWRQLCRWSDANKPTCYSWERRFRAFCVLTLSTSRI